jgi:mitochondrial chaperone BCS1
VASAEGRMMVMTTNHIERLDPALIRPGRADVKLAFGNATAAQAGRLFARFFPKEIELASAFAGRLEDRRFSMATLQDYLMLHRRDPAQAVYHLGVIGEFQLASATAQLPPGPREARHTAREKAAQANGRR